jgi:hypothetical protein
MIRSVITARLPGLSPSGSPALANWAPESNLRQRSHSQKPPLSLSEIENASYSGCWSKNRSTYSAVRRTTSEFEVQG